MKVHTLNKDFQCRKTALYLKKMLFGTFITGEINSMLGFKASKDWLNLFLVANASGYFKVQVNAHLPFQKTEGP